MIRFVCASMVFFCLCISEQAEGQFSFLKRKPPPKTITAKEVYRLINLPEKAERREGFVLVDVRSEKEQAVSIIPGAITAKQYEKYRKKYQGQTVIAYCTIGVRSGHFAQELIASGQTALNFKGSILEWCKEKFPLVTPAGKPTKRVHTYSARYNKVPGEYVAVY